MNLSPLPIQKFFDNNGRPLDGGLLFTYISGTTTKIATYPDDTGVPTNTNPIVLDFRGEARIWLDPTLTYTFVLSPKGDTDPPTKPIWTVDKISAALTAETLTQQMLGQILWPQTGAESGAGIIPSGWLYETPHYDIRRYGATKASSNAANKTALQTAISACSAEGSGSGGTVVVPANISYGYDVTDPTTWPDFSACLTPCLVMDYGPGDSFSGFPAAYDGAQIRWFFFTPQTTATVTFTAGIAGGATSATLTGNWTATTGPWQVTFSNGDVRYVTFTNGATTATWTGGLSSAATASATYLNPGQHHGNQLVLRGTWNPGVWLQSDGVLGAPGSATRTALDNRRCQIGYGVNGDFRWNVGQGTLAGPSYTEEELTNFIIEKLAVSGDTLGSYPCFLVERKTGNQSFGLGGNVPATSFAFSSVRSGFDQVMFENIWDTQSRLFLRPALGSTHDGGIGVDSSGATGGNLFLWFRSSGHCLDFNRTTRMGTFATAATFPTVAVTFSASITWSSDDANYFTTDAVSGVAFTINAPTEAATNYTNTITIRNTSGGALGAATWNAVFKMAAWTNPANGFSRSITFRYNGTNWVEISRTTADVPN